MNVIMLLTNPCNPDVRVLKEAKYLKELGHNVIILCWDRDQNTSLPIKSVTEGIQIMRIRVASKYGTGYKQLGAFLKYVIKCKQYIKKQSVDYIHCHDLDGMVAFKLMMINKPYVFDMHEFFVTGSFLIKKLKKIFVENSIKKSVGSICVHNRIYSKTLSSKVISKLYNLKNYPDATVLEYKEKTKSDKLRIGYMGTVRRQIPHFHALFEACSDMNNVEIDIYGGGVDLEQLLEMEKQYANVKVHGPYDGMKESSDLYQTIDVLFCGYDNKNPNFQEDINSVKFFEAIITQTPIIMTDGIFMAEEVRRLKIGYTVDTTNAEQLKIIVNHILEAPSELREFQENMKKITPNYKWENEVKVLEQIYGRA